MLIKKNYDPPFFTDQMKVVTEIKYITFLLLAVKLRIYRHKLIIKK